VKSSSSILTAVGNVVSRCSRVTSDWEMGIMVGSWCWMSSCAGGWHIAGSSGCVGAGRASILGDVSISRSLEESAAGRSERGRGGTIVEFGRLC
jgi:hypothetical protein